MKDFNTIKLGKYYIVIRQIEDYSWSNRDDLRMYMTIGKKKGSGTDFLLGHTPKEAKENIKELINSLLDVYNKL